MIKRETPIRMRLFSQYFFSFPSNFYFTSSDPTQPPERLAQAANNMGDTELPNRSKETLSLLALETRLSKEQLAELQVFQRQNRIRLEREKRRKDFEREIQLRWRDFWHKENEVSHNTFVHFGHRLLVRL